MNNPTELELLFRASENQYLAEKFHEKCDDVPHTFTMVKTEFGKTICGYTPLTWNEKEGEVDYYADDPSGQSFLLSLDMGEKMDLIDKVRAISIASESGPVFGHGYDLCVRDECHLDKPSAELSFARFPWSYNNKKNKYKKDKQEVWEKFSGASKDSYFKITEYEVYRVSW